MTRAGYRVARLPTSGMRNQKTATRMISEASPTPTTSPGTALPMRISTGLSGVTSSWSKVPASRSRATERAVTTRVTIMASRAMIPGTMNHWLSRLGLNQARMVSWAGRLVPMTRSAHSWLKSVTMVRT